MKARLWYVMFGNNFDSCIVNAKDIDEAIKKARKKIQCTEEITEVKLTCEED